MTRRGKEDSGISYASAGVDIEAGDRAAERADAAALIEDPLAGLEREVADEGVDLELEARALPREERGRHLEVVEALPPRRGRA